MARTVDTEVRAVRRDAFVDVATRLIQAKGYEQMSVQDVLDALDASRGAFYHYFESKAELLEAALERMTDAVLASVAPLLADPGVNAIDKLHRFFGQIAQWKNARKDLVLSILPIWYSDDNSLVREKFRKAMTLRMAPVLAGIIRQGTEEGVFAVGSADDTARVLWGLMQSAQDAAGELFLARRAGRVSYEGVVATLAAYPEAFARIVGAPSGSIRIADEETLRIWFT